MSVHQLTDSICAELLKVKAVEVPDWLKKLDKSWRPGKLMSMDAIKQLFVDDSLLTLYQKFTQDTLAKLGESYIALTHPLKQLSFYLPWDTKEENEYIVENLSELLEDLDDASKIKQRPEDVLKTGFSPDELFVYSPDHQVMCAKINQFLGAQLAKGKDTKRKGETTRLYTMALWSKNTSFSLIHYLQKNHSADTTLGNLMYRKDAVPIKLDSQFDNYVLAYMKGESGEPHPSTRAHLLNGVLALLDYLEVASTRVSFNKETETVAINEQTLYQSYIVITKDRLKKHCIALQRKSRETATSNIHQQELLHPGSRELAANGFDSYYRGEHYTATLLRLSNMSEAVSEATESGTALTKAISPREFLRMGHFLMILLCLSNGHRRSDPEKMRLKHARERREIIWAHSADQIKFIPHSFMKSSHYQYIIGADDARHGVTNFKCI